MDQIAEVKQKTDIVDIISGYVDLKKSGRNYKGLCPFHSEKTPSFMVSQELQLYKCFGCGEGGDVFTFLEKIEGYDFSHALEVLADRAGIKLVKSAPAKDTSKEKLIYEINELTALFYHKVLTATKAGKPALAYLRDKRKLTLDTIKVFQLGYSPDTWDTLLKFLTKKGYKATDLEAAGVIVTKSSGTGYIDKFRGRVMFPFSDVSGRIVGFSGRTISDRKPKYLNSPETLVFHKSNFLYGLDKGKIAIKQEGAVFVEGPMDVISAYQAGIKNVVASSGTSLTEDQLRLISRYTKNITFCFDSDFAGISAIKRAISLAEKQHFDIKVAMVPEKYKDLDELVHEDTELAKQLFANAVVIYDFFLVAALKRHQKTDPLGKKNIVEELLPVFSQITSPIVRDHYVEKLSQELNVKADIIRSLLTNRAQVADYEEFKEAPHTSTSDKAVFSKSSYEEYFLALLLQSNVDIIRSFLYKHHQEDFANVAVRETLAALKTYLHNAETYNVEAFIDTMNVDFKNFVRDVYLWDVGSISENSQNIVKELTLLSSRIEKKAARDKITALAKKLKLAEAENNVEAIKKLSEGIKELSEKLL